MRAVVTVGQGLALAAPLALNHYGRVLRPAILRLDPEVQA